MAQEISRTFDTTLAAVIVNIRDEFGKDSPHTIHLFNVNVCPCCGCRKVLDVGGAVDVDATVAGIIAEMDANTERIKQGMIAAGWKP
jgi:hypothetical protein